MSGVKSIIKRMLSTSVPIGCSRGRSVVLCYHHLAARIGRLDSPSYTTGTDLFVRHMELVRGLFDVVPLDDLVQERTKGRNRLAITFDDGFMSVFTIARPILRSMGIPYTVFINGAAVVEGRNWVVDLTAHEDDGGYGASLLVAAGLNEGSVPGGADTIGAIMAQGRFSEAFGRACRSVAPPSGVFMGRKELKQLADEGVVIGDHGWDHYVMGRCTPQVVVEQISKGKALVKELTGTFPKHFALPFGKKEHFSTRTLELLGEFGYQYVYTTNPNLVSDTAKVHGVRLVPRIGLVNDPAHRLLFYLNRALLRQHDL